MNIIIKAKGNVKLTDAVRNYFDKQLKTAEKLFAEHGNINVNVSLEEKAGKYKCEITIFVKQVVLRAECKGDTLYAAFDQAADKVEQQLIKHKKKANDFLKKREGVAEFFTSPVEEDEEQIVIKHKKVELMEMSIDEAITQMELVDHTFYMFRNEDNHQSAVVYKRADGNYGVIEEM